jgi:Family of unknown function (DUF6115)
MAVAGVNYWVLFQIVMDGVLVALVLLLMRHMKSAIGKEAAMEASQNLMAMMEPLVREAEAVARSFEEQLKEKKNLAYQLNEDLDRRIISLNMLLNRARAYLDDGPGKAAAGQVYKQQDAILELYNQHHDSEAIAKKLSIPKAEVDLVIDLKTAFLSKK